MLETDGEDQLDRSCEKLGSVLQGGSNMTGTSAACLHTNQSRSYLNHLVHRVKEERNILHSLKIRKDNWIGIGHVLRRNCILKHVFEGKLEVTRRRGTRRR